MTDYLRGHEIVLVHGRWRFKDTKECTETTWKHRLCGHCGQHSTVEGHDACLGSLPNVKNACCGHGIPEEAYIQFNNDTCIRGLSVGVWCDKQGNEYIMQKIDRQQIESILKKVFGNEFPMKNSNFWREMASKVSICLEQKGIISQPDSPSDWTPIHSFFSTLT